MAVYPGILDPCNPHPAIQRALRAWLAVQREMALRPAEAVAALDRYGDPERVLARRSRSAVTRAELDAACRCLRRIGAVAIPLTSPLYPRKVRNLPDAAPLLLVRGDPRVLAARAVAIVGSRAATRTGMQFAQHLAGDLARARVLVVSGLARGIDGSAHRGALEAGGLTVAVQACGPDLTYPPEHRCLAQRIALHGALVSELPPGTPPLKHHFPLRNRLISALVSAVVVVEARDRSGSLITAEHASEQGVDVMAVPGAINAATSQGSNRLLRDGAHVVLDANDVLQVLGLRRCSRPPQPEPEDESQVQVLAALRSEPATPDELGRRLGRSPQALAIDLVNLELAGLVVEDRDGRLRATSPGQGAGL